MSEQYSPEEQIHQVPSRPQVQPAAQRLRGPAAVVAVAVTVLGAGAYSIHEHSAAEAARQQNADVVASLRATDAQVEQLTAKLNELTAPKPAAEVPVRKSVAKASGPHRARSGAVVRRDDPRWKKVQEQLAAQGKSIDEQGRTSTRRARI